MGEPVALAAAFVAGLLSFFSPYVLPLIPGYLSYISGLSLDEMRGTTAASGAGGVAVATPTEARRRVVVASAAFCLGFSAVFVMLGASAGAIGQWLFESQWVLDKVGGAIIIAFGLHTMGVAHIGWLHRARRVHTRTKPPGMAGALSVGALFALGWTPCLGPILAGVVTVAITQDTAAEGARLLAAYAFGLAVPFLAASFALNHYFAAFARLHRHYRAIEIVSGGLLVAIGLLIFTNQFARVAGWLAA
jgi:cytochrome c-type biogenesis protein